MTHFITLIWLSIFWACSSFAQDFNAWLQNQKNAVMRDLLANIHQPDTAPGVVVASTSRVHPSYYYDWTRDGAITMQEIVKLYRDAGDATQKQLYFDRLLAYAQASRQKQLTPNRSGNIGDLGFGEPKWNVDLSPFNEDWARPQNDGPALRACTLIAWAFALLHNNQSFTARWLYDTVILPDLEFTARHWREPSFDMWEEVKGLHFSTLIEQQRALYHGSLLAARLNNHYLAKAYEKHAQDIGKEFEKYWNDARGYIIETREQVDGITDKISNLDTATILSLLGQAEENAISIVDDRVLATAEALRARMHELYLINQTKTNDGAGEMLGDAMGRYPEDRYNGYTTDGQGNPWFLITAGFAEFSYSVALTWLNAGAISITERTHAFLRSWLREKPVSLEKNEIVTTQDPRFKLIIDGMKKAGDSYLRRWRAHALADDTPAEEFNRYSGHMQGAEKLTWNCAAFLSALTKRELLTSQWLANF